MILDKIFKNEKGEYIDIFSVIHGSNSPEAYMYTIAEAHAIDLIAKTIAKTELQVYEMNKKTKKIENKVNDTYWLLNLQPNDYESGTVFLYKLAIKLLIDRKALIYISETKKGTKLFVADTFDMSNDITKGKTFSNIKIRDDENNIHTINKATTENSIYFSFKNDNLLKAKESFKKNIADLVKVITQKYKRSNVSKWRLKKPGGQPTLMDFETGKEISYEAYKKKVTEGLLSDEESIVMLSEVFDLMNLNKDSTQNLEDYKDIFKKIGDTVANIYDIPLDIFYGNKTEKSNGNNDFITFAVDIYYEIIEDGFNIGFVGKDAYIQGEKIAFNRFAIFHKDILEAATGIDKLISNTFSRNEVNKFLKLPYIDEDWANEHNLTKNYAKVKGGEENNE